MNTDRNLLFGALAFQNEYIDLAQFAAVCRAWAADKSRPLADLLVERGWITIAKPANPGAPGLGGFGEVLLLDWGIAKVVGATDTEASTLGFSHEAQTAATQTGARSGTPEYMALELAETYWERHMAAAASRQRKE